MLVELGLPPFGDALLNCNVAAIMKGMVKRGQHVRGMAMVVGKVMLQPAWLPYNCELTDPTGSLQGRVHIPDLRETPLKGNFAAGAVLLLDPLALDIPSGWQVVPLFDKACVKKIYPPWTPVPEEAARFVDLPLPSIYQSRPEMEAFYAAQPHPPVPPRHLKAHSAAPRAVRRDPSLPTAPQPSGPAAAAAPAPLPVPAAPLVQLSRLPVAAAASGLHALPPPPQQPPLLPMPRPLVAAAPPAGLPPKPPPPRVLPSSVAPQPRLPVAEATVARRPAPPPVLSRHPSPSPPRLVPKRKRCNPPLAPAAAPAAEPTAAASPAEPAGTWDCYDCRDEDLPDEPLGGSDCRDEDLPDAPLGGGEHKVHVPPALPTAAAATAAAQQRQDERSIEDGLDPPTATPDYIRLDRIIAAGAPQHARR